jgi:hypothetical protein
MAYQPAQVGRPYHHRKHNYGQHKHNDHNPIRSRFGAPMENESAQGRGSDQEVSVPLLGAAIVALPVSGRDQQFYVGRRAELAFAPRRVQLQLTATMGLGTKDRQKQTEDICKKHLWEKCTRDAQAASTGVV